MSLLYRIINICTKSVPEIANMTANLTQIFFLDY